MNKSSCLRAAAFCVALPLTACVVLPRNAVPLEQIPYAEIPGFPHVRGWAGRPNAEMERDFEASFAQESPSQFPLGPDGKVHYAHLSLSGGGSHGAFGAGVLNGWTKTGRRPVFKFVTGVSTGALMAPFAFLGSGYDDQLRELYTTISSRDIFLTGGLVARIFRGESLALSDPLAAMIDRHLDSALLRHNAEAHRQGRRLYIGTADLDAQRFVVWNMGAIAQSNHPEALELFRKVMLASASIPIVFPPVMFTVEAGGGRYDELHVDGAVGTRVFYTGGVFRPALLRERAGRGNGIEDLFVIHNGQLASTPEPTRRNLLGISSRTLDATGKSASIGDLFRIYTLTLKEGANFHWITMPPEVDAESTELFDPVKMAELYEVGVKIGLAGPVWARQPPGLQGVTPP